MDYGLPIGNEQPAGECTMIIETSDNRFYRVTESIQPELAHLWFGVPVKKVRGEWTDKKRARPQMVRKAASRLVEAT